MTRIETARLILRRPVAGDLPAYEAYCTSDRTRFTGGPYTRQDAFEKLAAMIGHWEIRGFGRLILCDRFTARPIGHVGALQLDLNTPVEMTWTLWADADEGLGFAYEAARAYLDEVAARGYFRPSSLGSMRTIAALAPSPCVWVRLRILAQRPRTGCQRR